MYVEGKKKGILARTGVVVTREFYFNVPRIDERKLPSIADNKRRVQVARIHICLVRDRHENKKSVDT